MSSDVVLDEDTVKVVDGSLEVEEGTSTRELEVAEGARADHVEVGTASDESEAAGTAWVNDRRGVERIYLNGGLGDPETDETDEPDEPESGGGSWIGRIPTYVDGRWGISLPKFSFRDEHRVDERHVDDSLGDSIAETLRARETHDEREAAPEHVRVYVEGDAGSIGLGGDGVDGDLVVTDEDGETTVHVNGYLGDVVLAELDDPVGESIRALEARVEALEERL